MIDVRKLTPEELSSTIENAMKGGMTESVEGYLMDFFKECHKMVWSKLLISKNDLGDLIAVKELAKSIAMLEQKMLIDKTKGKEAVALLKKLQETGRGYLGK